MDLRQLVDAHAAKPVLVQALIDEALVIEPVTLSSGQRAEYLVDAKKALGKNPGYVAVGGLVAACAEALGATAVGGLTMGAEAIAYSTLATAADLKVFAVRKEPKRHGLQRLIEGPRLDAAKDQCLVVDDVMTTGGSTSQAIGALQQEGLTVCGVVIVCDRLAGGEERLAEQTRAPFIALTTIDEVYPGRPDRAKRSNGLSMVVG